MPSKELNLQKLFSPMFWSLNLTGCHPFLPKNRVWVMKFIFKHGITTLYTIEILYSTIIHDMHDITQVCANLTLVVMYVVVSVKYFLMVQHEDELKELLNIMKSDYETAETLTDEERAVVVTHAHKGAWFMRIWFYLCVFVNVIFAIKNCFVMIYLYIVGKFKVLLLFPITYPYFIERVKFHPFAYFMLNGWFYFFDVHVANIYAGVVPLGPMFMLHATGQIEMLKIRVMKLFPDEGLDPRERNERIRVIAKQLQDVYTFVDTIQNCFMFLYELTLKGSSVILPVILYKNLEAFAEGTINVEYLGLFWGTVGLSGFPCYYGDHLMEQMDDFRHKVYSCGWEAHWDKNARNMLLVIMTRTVRTVAIRSVFRDICLVALTDVYRQAYAIFNFLITVRSS